MHVPPGLEIATALTATLTLPCVLLLVGSARRFAGRARRAHQTLACGAATIAGCVVAAVPGGTGLGAGQGMSTTDRELLATAIAVVYACGMLAVFVGMLRLPGVAGSLGAAVRHVLDCLVIAAAIWFVGWVVTAVPHPLLAERLPPGCVAVLVTCVTAALALGLAAILVLRCPRPRRGIVAASAGMSALGLGGVGLTGGLCAGSAAVLPAGAAGALVGLLALALGARRADRRDDRDTALMRNGTAFAFLPMVALSVAAILHWVANGRSYDVHPIAAGIIEGFALVGRQYLALLDVRRYAGQVREREAHFRELAHTDPLTGLANRRGLLVALRESAVGGPACVLMSMDLDGFKSINDMRGHDVGDQVLIEVGRRLRANLRPGDLAARLGGDEFAVLMFTRPPDAERVAERLLKVLCQPYEQPEGTVFLSASIGLAGCATANDVPTLLRNSDLALRFAKQRGKSRVERYDAAYDEQLRRRTTLEHELRGAVARGELHVRYQPVVALPSVRPVGAEALLRWHHPTLGQVSPGEFIPIAEESGAIMRLGSWVLHQACHQLSRWLADGHDVWVSVNVSPRELHNPEYVVQIAEVLEAHRVPPQRLVLEVTEHAVATDLDELISRLRALRMTGVRIALDDFGAGYSSLGQLRNLPVDILKIDQSLVAEPESSRTGTAAPLVDVVVRLGHRLGLEVIAEGIETTQQLGVVEEAGCRWGQGWLFGAGVPAEHLEARLAAVSGSGRAHRPALGGAQQGVLPLAAPSGGGQSGAVPLAAPSSAAPSSGVQSGAVPLGGQSGDGQPGAVPLAAPSSAAPSGSGQSGSVRPGAVPLGAQSGSVQPGAVPLGGQSGGGQPGAVPLAPPSSAAPSGSGQSGSVQPVAVPLGAQSGSVQPGAAPLGVQSGGIQPGPVLPAALRQQAPSPAALPQEALPPGTLPAQNMRSVDSGREMRQA